ncbi:hypothetical protein HY311_01860 [Candidatus Nomurabacteria bacterium]|nr:hypothetical protein [Candidatus Nomurabacteria bacterium]
MKKKSKISGSKVLMVEAGMAALGAGAYYLLGPDGKKNQKKAAALIFKIKKEVKSDAKKLKKEWKTVSKKAPKKPTTKKKRG